MANPSLPDFEAFWTFATERSLNCNDLSHHLCCDVWTTRNSKRSRTSHTKETKWRALLASLDSSAPDKKKAMHAKILEEGWRIPVLLNRPCSLVELDHKFPFRLHHPQSQHLHLPVYSENEGQISQYTPHNNNTHKLHFHQVLCRQDKEFSVQIFPIANWLPSQGYSHSKLIQTQDNQEMLNKMMFQFTNSITLNFVKLVADIHVEKAKETQQQLQAVMKPLSASLSRYYSLRQRQG